MRGTDVRVVQRAGAFIEDLGADLDRQLENERRPAERMRMLRETTNRITRVANDAAHAYRRASRAVSTELAKPNPNVAAAQQTRAILDAGRSDILRVLEVARRRYPWIDADADTTSQRRPTEGR
jgi:hypothetical protein